MLASVALGLSTVVFAQHSFEEVASGLKDKNASVRLRAVEILSSASYPEAAVPIASVLGDPDDRVQTAALAAERGQFLTRPITVKKKVGFIVEVRSSDAGGESAAAARLAVLPRVVPREVLAGLTIAMRDTNLRISAEAIQLFGLLATNAQPAASAELRSGATRLIEGLRQGDRGLQLASAIAAGRGFRNCGLTSSEVCDELGRVLVDAVNTRDPQVRRAVMQSVGQMRYGPGNQALADQLSFFQKGPDAQAALEGLAGIADPTSGTIFHRTLQHGEADMRRLAIEGIGRAGLHDEMVELQRIGQTETSASVLLAIHYAGLLLKHEAAAGALTQLVNALGNPSLQPLAAKYLLDVGPLVATDLAKSLSTPDPGTRQLVVELLGFSGSPDVIPSLEPLAKERDPDISQAAAHAIQRLKQSRN